MKILNLIILFGLFALCGCRTGAVQQQTTMMMQSVLQGGDPNNALDDSLDEMDGFDEEFADFEEEFADDRFQVYDPIENWNRGVFKFNDGLYTHVLRPFVKGYNAITPEPVRTGTRNFFHNLAMPVRAANCLLQGKFQSAGREVGRFCVNSVVGCFGCADPAADALDWQRADEDLGQTLAVWGVPPGPYLVWPVMGPSHVRDTCGRFGDYWFKPLSYVDAWEFELALKGVEYSNLASFSYEQYDMIKQEAIEPYIIMRDGYVQFRRQKILE